MKKSVRIILSVILALTITACTAIGAGALRIPLIRTGSCGDCPAKGCDILSGILSGCCRITDSCMNGLLCRFGVSEGKITLTPMEPASTEQPCEDCAPVTQATEAPAQEESEAPVTQATEEPVQELSAVPQDTTEAIAEEEYLLSEYESKVVELINDIRRTNGLSTLSIDQELCRVARIKAQEMHDKHYFDHNSPAYGTPFEMMRAFGIRYRVAGENIAVGFRTPQAVVEGWMNSDGHRANILNPGFTKIGMGYVADGGYWSQMFIG